MSSKRMPVSTVYARWIRLTEMVLRKNANFSHLTLFFLLLFHWPTLWLSSTINDNDDIYKVSTVRTKRIVRFIFSFKYKKDNMKGFTFTMYSSYVLTYIHIFELIPSRIAQDDMQRNNAPWQVRDPTHNDVTYLRVAGLFRLEISHFSIKRLPFMCRC